jgi:hypothetical protein
MILSRLWNRLIAMPSSSQPPIIKTGVVENGGIALDHPLAMPDGVKVRVSVEEIKSSASVASRMSEAEFRSLAFFGEWAGRTDLGSSEDYVREERAKWSQRLAREG